MADTGKTPGDDYKAHAETFKGFSTLMLWGTVGSALIGGFVVFLISQ